MFTGNMVTVTLNEYQLARFVYSVLLYSIAFHIVFRTVLTIKYDMATQ